MRAIIQRVCEARVTIHGKKTAEIQKGFLILFGAKQGDLWEDIQKLAAKCAGMRVFEDEQGKMNLSLHQVGGQALVVPNFTLYADCRRGNRPSFSRAEEPERAQKLFEQFVCCLRELGVRTQTGVFGADMKVELLNDGPVTLIVDTADFTHRNREDMQ